MTAIRAFVGHSFTAEDEPVVRALLSGALGSPYGGGVSPSAPQPKRKHEIRYFGHFEGGAFFGKIERKAEGESLLGSASTDNEVIMVLSPDKSKLTVMESPSLTTPKFYQLDRVY